MKSTCLKWAALLGLFLAWLAFMGGKGQKDRVTMLPEALVQPMHRHLGKVRGLHQQDLQDGFGDVHLPFALARKYPRAGYEWGWQYVFPSRNRSVDPDDGVIRRHHLDESVLRRAIKAAAQALGKDAGALEVLIIQLATIFREGKQLRMSTRAGEIISLREVVDEVGADAGRFFMLMRQTSQHLEFDIDLAKK